LAAAFLLALHDALPIRPAGSHGDRSGGGIPVPRFAARVHCAFGRRATVADRRCLYHADVWLLPELADAVIHGTGYRPGGGRRHRSEEHTSELQSRENLV